MPDEHLTAAEVEVCYHVAMLADMVAREAMGEPYEGLVAVAEVALERARDPRWPDNLADVILQRAQFASYLPEDSRVHQRYTPSREAEWRGFQLCCRAVADALTEQTNVSGRANHFINVETRMRTHGSMPDWYDEKKITVKIGRHTFLRL
jgi:spore germination cell wall hydrolase CwlJ-like protein